MSIPEPMVITDNTDRTDLPSNRQFLQAIFGEETRPDQPLVVSFVENPGNVDQRAWKGTDWQNAERQQYLSEKTNNYFSLSTYHPNENGYFSRKKCHFSALHAVMLDDVGTKVLPGDIKLAPSWSLETSPGNYQWGYILAEPLNDAHMADNLMKAIIDAKLCDPGAGGPTARLARLPVAVNSKHLPAFQCCINEWNPANRYNLAELVTGLGISISEPEPSKKQKTSQSHNSDTQENPVLIALKAKGLYKRPAGGQKHEITCPFVTEHTDGVDQGTTYFEPTETYPVGGFNCFHGHCQDRGIQDLLSFLNINKSAARNKPTIMVIPGQMYQAVDAAEQALATSNNFYQRGGRIVSVGIDPDTSETTIFVLKQAAVGVALSAAAHWEKYDRSDEIITIDPPPRHVGAVYDRGTYKHLVVLEGLARQPYFRPDGTLVCESGYDPATLMYGAFTAEKFSIPKQPTIEDARKAIEQIEALLNEFPFERKIDKSATLCAILTAATRPSLPTAPMFHVRAPQKGCGKTYLCELITSYATPQIPSPSTFPHDDEECKKVLLAELRRSPAVIYYDNLKTDLLDHSSLCKAITTQYINERILGFSEVARVPTRTLFLSCGNNVGPVQDMTRRCVTINLDPACEIPAARNFDNPNLLEHLRDHREKYVSAALTIVSAWIYAGRPKEKCHNLAGFTVWSDLCRQPLLWLGYSDPVEGVFEAIKSDPDQEMLGRILRCWQECFGKAPTMVREAVDHLNTELQELLGDIAPDKYGSINRRALGRWIKRNENRIVDGRKFVKANIQRNADVWQVESVKSVSSIPVSTSAVIGHSFRHPE